MKRDDDTAIDVVIRAIQAIGSVPTSTRIMAVLVAARGVSARKERVLERMRFLGVRNRKPVVIHKAPEPATSATGTEGVTANGHLGYRHYTGNGKFHANGHAEAVEDDFETAATSVPEPVTSTTGTEPADIGNRTSRKMSEPEPATSTAGTEREPNPRVYAHTRNRDLFKLDYLVGTDSKINGNPYVDKSTTGLADAKNAPPPSAVDNSKKKPGSPLILIATDGAPNTPKPRGGPGAEPAWLTPVKAGLAEILNKRLCDLADAERFTLVRWHAWRFCYSGPSQSKNIARANQLDATYVDFCRYVPEDHRRTEQFGFAEVDYVIGLLEKFEHDRRAPCRSPWQLKGVDSDFKPTPAPKIGVR